jgi:hypothetical protein
MGHGGDEKFTHSGHVSGNVHENCFALSRLHPSWKKNWFNLLQ